MKGPVSFTIPDYAVLGTTLIASLTIGFFIALCRKRQNTQVEYLLGSRSLSILPVCLSVFATFNSAISLLGNPAEIYTYGTMAIYTRIGSVIAHGTCMYTLLPLIHPLKITSIYEYLQLRFESRFVRLLGASIGMITNLSYMTVAILTPAIALQTVADMPLWISLLTVGTVGTVYTVVGGLRSVVWTDAFQTAIIFIGTIIILIKGTITVGGFSTVWQKTEELGRISFDVVDPDPRVRHSLWSVVIGYSVYGVAYQFGQAYSQRLCSLKSQRNSKIAVFINFPIIMIFGVLLMFTGMVILVYFDFLGCDPIAAGYIENNNQKIWASENYTISVTLANSVNAFLPLVPYFVMHVLAFAPGLAGLYISTIFAGALSTLSSGINSMVATTVEDILHTFIRRYKESTKTTIAKCVAMFIGLTIIGLAYFAKEIKGPITQVTYIIRGATAGPTFGLFCLGAIFPQTNKVGVSFGLFAGLAFTLWLNIGRMLHGALPPKLPPGSIDECDAWLNNTMVSGFIDNGTTEATVMPALLNSTTGTPIEDEDFSIYDISYLWPPVLGVLVTLVVGITVSLIYELITGEKKRAKPEHLFPFMRRFWYSKDQSVIKNDEKPEEMESMMTTKQETCKENDIML